jgi:5S rRNA maturation endonuclease (ribonuclease M5)/energy-coupling factor transporter ATP-binding protein EcfA2
MTLTEQEKLQNFLAKLNKVKKTGANQWKARCPAHDDNVASLSVSLGQNKINFHCHTNTCIGVEILSAINLSWSDIYFDDDNGRKKKESKTVAEYIYTDENGQPLHKTLRTKNKDFYQQSYVKGKWQSGLKGVKTLLYKLERVIEAIKNGQVVFIVEGEKDVDNLNKLGLTATCNAMGAGKWNKSYTKTLTGARVIIIPDNDRPGKKHAEDIASKLHGKAKSVKILQLPGLAKKEDVSDWINKGNTKEKLKQLRKDCQEWEPDTEGPGAENNNDNDDNLATKIYNSAMGNAKLFTDERDAAYAAISLNQHYEVWSIGSRRFNLWLQQKGKQCNDNKLPYSEAINQAKKQLEAVAYFQGGDIKLNNRVAKVNNYFYYDLSNKSWEAVKITKDDWEIIKPPILFRRNAHQKPQVKPAKTGNGDPWEFLNHVNVKKDNQLLLMVSLISALIPEIPHILTIIHGPQGSAKSTLLEFMRGVIDPSQTPLLRIPRNDRDIIQNFDHHYCTYFDNVSKIPKWLSDIFCRAVTGEGIEARSLYTDEEAFIRQYKRVIGLTGINVAATEPDLLDRSILIELNPIPKSERKEIRVIKNEFRKALPKILAGIFDTIVKAKNIYPDVELEELHRMADFSRWGYAIAEALGKSGDKFLQDYTEDEQERNLEVIEDNPLGQALLIFLEDRQNWKGSPGELLEKLERIAEKETIDIEHKLWPGSPAWVTRRINELQPLLVAEGINYKSKRNKKKRILFFSKGKGNGVTTVIPSPKVDKPRHNSKLNGDSKDDSKKNTVTDKKNTVTDKNPDTTGIMEGDDGNDSNDGKKHTSLTRGEV